MWLPFWAIHEKGYWLRLFVKFRVLQPGLDARHTEVDGRLGSRCDLFSWWPCLGLVSYPIFFHTVSKSFLPHVLRWGKSLDYIINGTSFEYSNSATEFHLPFLRFLTGEDCHPWYWIRIWPGCGWHFRWPFGPFLLKLVSLLVLQKIEMLSLLHPQNRLWYKLHGSVR